MQGQKCFNLKSLGHKSVHLIGVIYLIFATFMHTDSGALLAVGSKLPRSPLPPEAICKGEEYLNAKGEVQIGLRECSSIPICSESVFTECLATEEHLVVKGEEIIPGVIKSGVVLAGVKGVYEFFDGSRNVYSGTSLSELAPSIPNCTSDGQTDCLTSTAYPAALTTGLTSKILAGNVVAGVNGTVTLPNVNHVYSGVTYGPPASQLTGILTLPSAANVRTVQGPYGVGGNSLTPLLLDCSANDVVGCVTTSVFKSADWTNLNSSNIKKGVTVAGVLGAYPSSSNLLVGADSTSDLDSATFEAKIKSAASFEWFGPDGTRYTGSGDSDVTASQLAQGVEVFGTTGSAQLFTQCSSSVKASCEADSACRWNGGVCEINPWHIRAGVTLALKGGTLKTNCRNTINSTFNYDGSVASLGNASVNSGAVSDFWDTVDDHYNLAANKPAAWSSNTQCTNSNWTDVTTTDGGSSFTTCGTSSTCIYRDELSGLTVTGVLASGGNTTNTTSPASYNWSAAINACENSTYGGYTAGKWRLPTQKELMSLYTNSLVARSGSSFHSITNLRTFYWSSSTSANTPDNGWNVNMARGSTTNSVKTTSLYVMCVF